MRVEPEAVKHNHRALPFGQGGKGAFGVDEAGVGFGNVGRRAVAERGPDC